MHKHKNTSIFDLLAKTFLVQKTWFSSQQNNDITDLKN